MPIFDPPDLEERLNEALNEFHKILGEEAHSLFDSHSIEPTNWNPDDDSFLIGPQSSLDVRLPYCAGFEITCAQFLDLVDELESAVIEQNLECWTKRRLLLRIEPAFDQDTRFFGDVLAIDLRDDGVPEGEFFPFEVVVERRAFRCLLRGGLTPFGVLIAAGDDYYKLFPPILDEELFVEVSFEGSADRDLIRNIACSYLFEISTALQVDLMPEPRPLVFKRAENLDDIGVTDELRFSPLMIGKGITELLRLYQSAIGSSYPELQLIQFYKLFEHVSRTVVHKHLIEATRGKLLSTSALNPSAGFILELQALFEQHRNFTKDREAIKLTFKMCCELTELLKVIPRFLREKLSLSANFLAMTKLKDRQDLLEKIGECVVATRNALAHSKAAYEPTGEECPSAQLPELIKCMKVAAQQVIRWYDSQPEELRIM